MRWALLVMLIGCGKPIEYPEYVAAMRVANCERLARCRVTPDVATCLAHRPEQAIDAELLAMIDAGTLVFHPDVAESCIDTIRDLTCDATSAEYRRPKCFGLFTGTLRDDEPCVFDATCISGECWTESELTCDAGGCCRGTCVGNEPLQPQPAGGRCRYAPCVDSYCQDSTCMPLLPEGADCEIDLDRYDDEVCEYGLACAGYRCVATAGTGESCAGKLCRNIGEYCAVRSGTCERRRYLNEPCAIDECASIYKCDATYHCAEREQVDPPRIAVGAPCRYSIDACIDGAFCDADLRAGKLDGICTLPKPLGASCLWDGQCESDSCSQGVCIADHCF